MTSTVCRVRPNDLFALFGDAVRRGDDGSQCVCEIMDGGHFYADQTVRRFLYAALGFLLLLVFCIFAEHIGMFLGVFMLYAVFSFLHQVCHT